MPTPKVSITVSLTLPLHEAIENAAAAQNMGRATFIRATLEERVRAITESQKRASKRDTKASTIQLEESGDE